MSKKKYVYYDASIDKMFYLKEHLVFDYDVYEVIYLG